MSREVDTRRSTRPAASCTGATATSHHFGVPRAVGQKASNRAGVPERAPATAFRTWARPASGQARIERAKMELHVVAHRAQCGKLEASLL